MSTKRTCPHCGATNIKTGDGILVDEERGVLTVDGVEMRFPRREIATLAALATTSPRVTTKEFISDYIYGLESDDTPDPKIVDIFVCKLRKKLPPSIQIRTDRGRGYILERAPAEAIKNLVA